MKKENDNSLVKISLLQALGLLGYCSLIALIMSQGNRLFGRLPNYLGPLLFLTLFATSALICAIIVGYYPFILLWEKKKTDQAIKVVLYTAGWLAAFVVLLFLTLFLIR